MDMGTCSDSKQGDHTYAVKNESSLEDHHEYVENNAGLKEHDDAGNKMSVETESMILSRQDVTSSSLGRCDSGLLWQGRRTIDSMLIDEVL